MSLIFTPHKHEEWKGKHSFLSPSSHRLDRDLNEEDFIKGMRAQYSAAIGTAIHEKAEFRINNKLRIRNKTHAADLILEKLVEAKIPRAIIEPGEFAETFMAYVNDAIGYDMFAEVPVGISDEAFGTIDAMSFNYKTKLLRIHDLKTGRVPAKIEQLVEYVAYFCIEYKLKPGEISTELRIYQSGEIITVTPTAPDILPFMERIKRGDNIMKRLNGG
jgi:hypothetical protein